MHIYIYVCVLVLIIVTGSSYPQCLDMGYLFTQDTFLQFRGYRDTLLWLPETCVGQDCYTVTSATTNVINKRRRRNYLRLIESTMHPLLTVSMWPKLVSVAFNLTTTLDNKPSMADNWLPCDCLVIAERVNPVGLPVVALSYKVVAYIIPAEQCAQDSVDS